LELFKNEETLLKNIFESYQNSIEVLPGSFRPSGVDVLAQVFYGVCFVSAKAQPQVVRINWPFLNLKWVVEPSGIKVNTHEHLRSLGLGSLSNPAQESLQDFPHPDFSDLEKVFKKIVRALFQEDSDVFLSSLGQYRQILFSRGWEHPETTKKIQAFKTSTGEVMKGCGAWGADVYLKVLRNSKHDSQGEDFTEASAPSNIALVKYMGKRDSTLNLPANPSLSWTMEKYRSTVRLVPIINKYNLQGSLGDRWEAHPNFPTFQMSEKGKQKFLSHFARLKKIYGVNKYYFVQSGNNFVSDAGLASSASSFAALTLAAHSEFTKALSGNALDREKSLSELSSLSREGSGSSCRSFFSPWAEWDEDGARGIETEWNDLFHRVVLISSEKKSISSSEAHSKVLQSPQFSGRRERASSRFLKIRNLLRQRSQDNWREMFYIVWDEFEDMHSLFETCPEPFTYRNEQVFQILDFLRNFWQMHRDGPLVTMDAGPNIHLLFRADQEELSHRWELEGLYMGKVPR
jgi:diphosphomevalonate decarboxylase